MHNFFHLSVYISIENDEKYQNLLICSLNNLKSSTLLLKGQSKNYKIYLAENNFQLWPFMIPVSVVVEVHTVSHFKAPVYGKEEPRGQEHGDIYIF